MVCKTTAAWITLEMYDYQDVSNPFRFVSFFAIILAAATMCQYAMKLGRPSFPMDTINVKWGEIASAYLTAINSLQLAGPNSTWVSVTISDEHQSEVCCSMHRVELFL